MGPVWASWAYGMERVCGEIQRAIKARRFIYASIDKAVLQKAQIDMVKLRYHGMKDALTFGKQVQETGDRVGDCACPHPVSILRILILITPCSDHTRKRLLLGPKTSPASTDNLLITRLSRTLAEKFRVSEATAKRVLERVTLTEWRGIRITESGDRIRVAQVVGAAEDSREACWVQVWTNDLLRKCCSC
jgi:hypothetical protein